MLFQNLPGYGKNDFETVNYIKKHGVNFPENRLIS